MHNRTPPSIDEIITYMENTKADERQLDVCRSKDGKRNCLLGHLFNMGGNNLIDYFEEVWATSFMFYPVNDGKDKNYQQPTARERVIQYLKDLKSGKAKTTQVIDKEYYSMINTQG